MQKGSYFSLKVWIDETFAAFDAFYVVKHNL